MSNFTEFTKFQLRYMEEVEHLCSLIPSDSILLDSEINSIMIYFDSALSILRRCCDYVNYIKNSKD